MTTSNDFGQKLCEATEKLAREQAPKRRPEPTDEQRRNAAKLLLLMPPIPNETEPTMPPIPNETEPTIPSNRSEDV